MEDGIVVKEEPMSEGDEDQTVKKRRQMRFSVEDNLALLRLVLSENPYLSPKSWRAKDSKEAKRARNAAAVAHFNKVLSSEVASEANEVVLHSEEAFVTEDTDEVVPFEGGSIMDIEVNQEETVYWLTAGEGCLSHRPLCGGPAAISNWLPTKTSSVRLDCPGTTVDALLRDSPFFSQAVAGLPLREA
ncbi:hypothetical protein GE061_008851 [Apolygus lucorum]|uniref:Uncharacterized protein n=1 Tax=Apolygus lucorum TaxID=248454 RepID=A0A8S9WM61_APOLU|nr:hypothetical protein GE061_008851 [Apolygus lucorum]